MPIYEFKCPACDAGAQKMLRIEDRNLTLNCHECGKPMEKQFSAPAIHFNGKGFPGNDMKRRR